MPVLLFVAAFVYLHQKVQIHVEAYRLSASYSHYNELLDQRDYLLHTFSRELSLMKINQWAQHEKFTLADKTRIVAFTMNKEQPARVNTMASFLGRLLRLSGQTAMAGEKR